MRSRSVALTIGATIVLAAALWQRESRAEPAPFAAMCGNGLLEDGESCETCATDCVVRPCTPQGAPRPFVVNFTPATAMRTSSVTVQIAYRSDRINVSGHGADDDVKTRVTGTPANSSSVANDLDYALGVVVSHPDQIRSGPLLALSVTGCAGAPAPTATDFSCTVVGCASASGDIKGCTCAVTSK